MTQKALTTPLPMLVEKPTSDTPFARSMRDILHNQAAVVALIVLIAIILSAIFANYLTPYDPIGRDAKARLLAPSIEHPFGTDSLGRDMLGRILYGGRISLQVGFVSVLLSTVIGLPLGLIAGYIGGRTDNWIMRVMDLILAFPGLILAIWLISMLGASIGNMIIAISVFSIPSYARMTRGITLSTREMDYVIAARSMGAGAGRILWSHIFPSVVGPMIVLTTLGISGAIVTGASLSFLGLGVRPPSPEWGAMLSDGRGYMRNAWWMAVFPGFAITLVVLAANVLGDGLRDALDPKSRLR